MYVCTCTWLLPRNFSYKSPTNHLAFCDLLVFSSRHNRSRQCHLLNTAEFLYIFIFVVVAPVAPGLITAGVHADFNDYGLVSWTGTYSARNHRCTWGIFSSDSVQMKAINCYNNTWIDTLLQYVAAAQFHRISSTHVCSSYATQFFAKCHLQCLLLVMSDQADYNVNHYKRQRHSVWRLSYFTVYEDYGISFCTRIMVFHGVWRGLWCFTVYEDYRISQYMRIMAFHVVWGSWYFTVCDKSYGVSQCMKIIAFHSVWGLWHFMLYEDHGILQCVTRVMVFHRVWRLLYLTVYEDYGISLCMRIIVVHSEWRLSYFTVYVEGYGFHSVWGSSYFTVYDQGCGISRCMKIIVSYRVWGGLWYFTVYEDYGMSQCMRIMVFQTVRVMVFHSVWGLRYFALYEDHCISQCMRRVMVFHSVWGLLYFTVYEDYGISQCMRRIVVFHRVWGLWYFTVYEDYSLYNTAPRPLQCFISKLRNRDIIKLFGFAVNWKCQRNIRNIIAFPAAWLSTITW